LVRSIDLRNFAGLPSSLAISVLAFGVALPFAHLDFDPHHDGVMVAAAVAVRDGAVIQRDAFAQYGPVTPIIQGFVLKFIHEPVLGLRLVNVIAIAVVAFALADLGRRAPRYWPVSLSVGRWAALAWIAVADFFLWVPQLPWSSTIAAAILTLTLLFIARTLHFTEAGRMKAAIWAASAATFLLATLPFTRVNVGLASVVAVSIVSMIVFWLYPTSRRFLLRGMSAWLVFTAAIFVVLALTGALSPWWNQAIIWPLEWASSVSNQLGPDTFIKEIITTFWPALLAISLIVAASPWWSQASVKRRPWVGVVALLTSIGLLLVFYRNAALPRIFLAAQRDGRSSFIDGLTRGTLTLLTFLVVVILVIAVVGTIRAVPGFVRGGQTRAWALAWLLMVGFALAGLLQFAPVPDSRHIWWGLPVGLVVLMAAFGRRRTWSPLRNPLSLVLMAAGVAAMLSGPAYLSIPRVPELPGGVASGMLGPRDEVERTTDIVQMLFSTVGQDHALFLVAQGAWSVFDGSYHSPDEAFVNWGTKVDLAQRISRQTLLVTDMPPQPGVRDALIAMGFASIAEIRNYTVWSRRR
jgi:hypothetical protein